MKSLLLILAASAVLSGCGKPQSQKYEFNEILMHTVFKVVIYSDSGPEKAQAIANGAFDICRTLEVQYSTTLTNSFLYRLNTDGQAEIDPETFRIVQKALDLSRMTGGKYDISIYPLMKAWGFYDEHYRIPSKREISGILAHVGYRNILLLSNSVKLMNGAKIDLGGILKGYTVNRMVDFLKAKNIKAGLVDAGGNLTVFGIKPDKSRWTIGIRHPRQAGELYTTFKMTPETSIATSGDYEQFFITNDIRYFHIMNPATGYPINNHVVSASVIIPLPGNADGYSSSFFLMGAEQGIAYANESKIPVLYILETNSVLYSTNSIWWR